MISSFLSAQFKKVVEVASTPGECFMLVFRWEKIDIEMTWNYFACQTIQILLKSL